MRFYYIGFYSCFSVVKRLKDTPELQCDHKTETKKEYSKSFWEAEITSEYSY